MQLPPHNPAMPKAEPLDLFLDAVAQVHSLGAGTKETSFYPALAETFKAAGEALTPRVVGLHHPAGKQAGIPDFGLFVLPKSRRGEAPK